MQKGSNSDNWHKLQCELKSTDLALKEATKVRDDLINKQRQKELSIQRIGDQQKALELEYMIIFLGY